LYEITENKNDGGQNERKRLEGKGGVLHLIPIAPYHLSQKNKNGDDNPPLKNRVITEAPFFINKGIHTL
jgi:hypothetical protein